MKRMLEYNSEEVNVEIGLTDNKYIKVMALVHNVIRKTYKNGRTYAACSSKINFTAVSA